jgi:hypothetical protein
VKSLCRVSMLALVATSFTVLGARSAAAQTQSSDVNKADARAAYDGAALAYTRGDFLVAAREFARADEIDPNDVALAQALESATRASAAAIGMNLVERAHSREVSADVQTRVDEATAALAPLASKIVISCDECDDTKVDNIESAHLVWVEPGAHVVEMRRGEHIDRIEVHATAGASFEATPPPLPPPPPPPVVIPQEARVKEVHHDGVSPYIFWGAAGVTAIAGAFTIASAVDTVHQHSVFQANPNDTTASAGEAAEGRTNVLLGVTAAAAVTTAVIGIVFVHWTSPKKSSDVALSVSPSTVTFGGRF